MLFCQMQHILQKCVSFNKNTGMKTLTFFLVFYSWVMMSLAWDVRHHLLRMRCWETWTWLSNLVGRSPGNYLLLGFSSVWKRTSKYFYFLQMTVSLFFFFFPLRRGEKRAWKLLQKRRTFSALQFMKYERCFLLDTVLHCSLCFVKVFLCPFPLLWSG